MDEPEVQVTKATAWVYGSPEVENPFGINVWARIQAVLDGSITVPEPELLDPAPPKAGDMIELPKLLVQILFDTAVQSMDFGSGFLDDEEVFALRQTAEILGVDPMEGTPYEYRKRIAHTFAQKESALRGAPPGNNPSWKGRCQWCDKPREDAIHAEETDADDPDHH